MNKEPPLLYPHITAFPMIDGAMVRVVRAAASYEKAIYTPAERAALDRLVKTAIELKATFEKLAKHINEDYAAGQEGQEDKDSKAQ